MSSRFLISICVIIGSMVGGYIPVLWGDNSLFSFSSIIGNLIGGAFGIWVGIWIYNNYFE